MVRVVFMKIKEIHLEQFKRFTDLTVANIPQSVKLVVLVGPNGCGKSSLFDAFKSYHLNRGYSLYAKTDYCNKDQENQKLNHELVNIQFYDDVSGLGHEQWRQSFYFRTAYRNSPEITIKSLNKVTSPLEYSDNRMMIQNDDTVNDNYQRLISKTIEALYDVSNNEKTVEKLREELINKIREPLRRLFPDLLLTEIGLVTEKAEFYFSKGCVEKYGYEKLSGGEKAAFDLLLDLVVKSEYYKDTIFCIDEPETHIHTALQAQLLKELFALIPSKSQLWIATHSFGMLKEARKLYEANPNEVVFLNFDGYDFDDPVTIEPSKCDATLWNKMIEITLDDYAPFLTPDTIVFCEGTSIGRKRKDFDARCYANMFRDMHPNTVFYSLGGCNDVAEKDAVVKFVTNLSPQSKVIRIVDRDDRSPEEVSDLNNEGIKVLSKRHLECYLLDDEVLIKWCTANRRDDKIAEMLAIKNQKMSDSVARGNPSDDVKSAANDICTSGKKLLSLTACGNNGEAIMRDTISKLFSPDMAIYKQLENEIFS